MLYMLSLSHSPDKCPGVATEIRDRVLVMASTMTEVLNSYNCTFQGGWVSKSAHQKSSKDRPVHRRDRKAGSENKQYPLRSALSAPSAVNLLSRF